MAFDPNTSVLAGIDNTTLQLWLTQAQNGLVALNMGQREVTIITTGGGQHREVTFDKSPDSLAKLTYWIKQLQAQLRIIPAPRSGARIRYH